MAGWRPKDLTGLPARDDHFRDGFLYNDAMESWQERIAVNPKVMGGRPVIKGTRVPVQTIIAFLAGGESVTVVCEQFSVTQEDVMAALAYAADVLQDERVYALPA